MIAYHFKYPNLCGYTGGYRGTAPTLYFPTFWPFISVYLRLSAKNDQITRVFFCGCFLFIDPVIQECALTGLDFDVGKGFGFDNTPIGVACFECDGVNTGW